MKKNTTAKWLMLVIAILLLIIAYMSKTAWLVFAGVVPFAISGFHSEPGEFTNDMIYRTFMAPTAVAYILAFVVIFM